ncbi:MAG: hypothetical protein AAGM67_21095, partial [Bacteroidota bacterium]
TMAEIVSAFLQENRNYFGSELPEAEVRVIASNVSSRLLSLANGSTNSLTYISKALEVGVSFVRLLEEKTRAVVRMPAVYQSLQKSMGSERGNDQCRRIAREADRSFDSHVLDIQSKLSEIESLRGIPSFSSDLSAIIRELGDIVSTEIQSSNFCISYIENLIRDFSIRHSLAQNGREPKLLLAVQTSRAPLIILDETGVITLFNQR